MRVAIVGSRRLKADISAYVPEGTTAIISGGCRGIDRLAEQYADARHIPKLIFRPQYFLRSKKLPYLRHQAIVNSAEMVLAIWNGTSPGTKYIIEYAQSKGVPVQIIHIASRA